MPLADPPRPSGDMQSVSQVVDYLIGYVRWFADFINHIDTLNVEELDATVINTGTLNAALVTIKSLLNAGAYIQIDGNGMSIYDGTKNTFIADITGLVTMTGALIQSSSAYPNVQVNSANSLFGAYQSATKYVKMDPAASSSNPGFTFQNGAGVTGLMYLLTTDFFLATPLGSANIQISSGKDLYLTANTAIKLNGSSLLMNNLTGYSGSFSVVTAVNFGTSSTTSKTVTVTNGIVTSVV